MAKWFGKIGYVETVETAPGVWTEDVIEKDYYGDIVRANFRNVSGDKINDDVNISNQISIIADPFANTNMHRMKYLTINGSKWKITSIDIQYPRLILEIGGIYNA